MQSGNPWLKEMAVKAGKITKGLKKLDAARGTARPEKT